MQFRSSRMTEDEHTITPLLIESGQIEDDLELMGFTGLPEFSSRSLGLLDQLKPTPDG